MELNEILQHVQGIKKVAANRYEAHCPVHGDEHPSLSIYVNSDWVNIKCFAGCSESELLEKFGLKKSDLYIGSRQYKPKVKNETLYEYKQSNGTLYYIKKRIDCEDGSKSFVFYRPNGEKGLNGLPHIPYNLPEVVNASKVYFVEGEKCASAVIEQGFVATTLDCGASSKWSSTYTKHFKGKDVIIIPDNDEAGMKYAKMIKQNIPWAVIKELPELKEKEDIYDWLQAGHSMSEIEKIPESVIERKEEILDFSADKRQQCSILLDLIKKENVDIFLNENNDAFVEIPVKHHKEIYELESKNFSLWAQKLFYKNTGKAICKDGLTQAVDLLIANARFDNKANYILSNRIAKSGTDFWYDLTNPDWSAIKTTPYGWSAVNDVPKLFCRYRHQVPQTMPQGGGDLTKIFQYINVKSYQMLFLCWLVSCFVPEIQHPMPILCGEKGAAKSTACILLKRLIDPSVMDTLTLSKDERSLVVNLQQHYFLPFDNISAISNETSDTLCRAITGGAVQQRRLYTNSEDYIFTFKRCLAINGISNVANRADLLDRSILFELERVSEDKRKELQAIYDCFEADRPYLLGAIFDILVSAMKRYPTVKLERLPRMADFCRWGYAIAEAIGGYGNKFLQEYCGNQQIQNTEAINADMVAFLLVEFMRYIPEWNGRISVLLSELCKEAERQGINSNNKNIPQAPNNLSRRIKAVKSNLEKVGITFDFDSRRSDGTYITLKNQNLSPLSTYRIDTTEILGRKGGDSNGDENSDCKLSPPIIPQSFLGNGDNEDNGDEYVEF